MGKKMKLPFLFKAAASPSPSPSAATSWQWPACVNNPKTLSFRANQNEDIYKTMNSAYLEFTESIPDYSEGSFSYEGDNIDPSALIRGLRSSDRLFFEPGETNSILEEARTHDFPYKETVSILAMDSRDPFSDFRASMEEMVEAHGLKDWECLEELLTWYLRVNGRSNHGYVIEAFVDLLLHLSLVAPDSSKTAIDEPACSSSSNTTLNSLTSPLSFSSSTYSSICSPCLSSLENEVEIVVEKVVGCSSSSSSSSHINASSSSSSSVV
ncbi:transcription repressor OFP15-like [Primulina tabacum]|uniref:transcription repressor OFP15-like n=1 Tax=Primulina tabacum TaxID=48773 RepID=UPI003F5A1AFF